MHNFKNRVLDPAIKQINEYTDIAVKVDQHKTGRSITGFSFKFKQKQKVKNEKVIEKTRDPHTTDFFIKMTDAQRHLFANKMSEMPEMEKYSQGTESYQQFAIRIADMLLEPDKFRQGNKPTEHQIHHCIRQCLYWIGHNLIFGVILIRPKHGRNSIA